MPDTQEIQAIIFAAIDELNVQREAERQLEKSLDTRLFGKDANVDSLDLVNLIVSVEAALAERFDVTVTLADERAFSRKSSPFKSAGSLLVYIEELLGEDQP